jgi:endoglucanase
VYKRQLQPGATYLITGWQGKVARLRFDPDRTVSRAIKGNQVGFRPGDRLKTIYCGAWIPGVGPDRLLSPTTWELVDATTRQPVLTGAWTLRDDASRCAPSKDERDPAKRPLITGERLYEADVAGWTTPGTYYLRAPGIGRSWTFRIADEVYGPAFYTAIRGLFHQRGSFALSRPFTAWERPRLHTAPVGESRNIPYSWGPAKGPKEYERFDVIAATKDFSAPDHDVVGEWYDAADWDRCITHYTIIWDLLWLFEQRPGVFTDRQLNLPESGNGIPDLLDEVEFGLRLWLRSQDARGGVSGHLETSTHTAWKDDTQSWTWSLRTRWSSLHFAAGAAWFARLVAPYDAALATRYGEAARRAFAFGCDPANSLTGATIPALKDRGQGQPYTVPFSETEDMVRPYEVMARAQLWLLDRDDALLEPLPRQLMACPPPYAWPCTLQDGSPWLYWHCAAAPLKDRLPVPVVRKVRGWLFAKAESLVGMTEAMPYRQSWVKDQDWWMSWGASLATNANRAILAATALAPQAKDERAILANAGAAFGANPLGMSWTTGIGEVYPVAFQHAWSEDDGIWDPMPGMTVYSVTEGTFFRLRKDLWETQAPGRDGQPRGFRFCPPPAVPVWRRWAAHTYENAGQCEFTVHETMSSTILTTGMLLSPGWLPDQRLRDREPRPLERLYGYWYVP